MLTALPIAWLPEGRPYFEALQKGAEFPFNMPFLAWRELNHHREELPHLAQCLMQRHLLSETAAHHCAQDMLRYRETNGQDPSSTQMVERMVQIAQRLEDKEYKSHDPAEVEFLRRKEANHLFRRGLAYDTSCDLVHAQLHARRSLDLLQRQIGNERVHTKQMELGYKNVKEPKAR